jgi:ribonuclease H2 subunit C
MHGIGTQHVHFRGRHLYGTDLSLPEKYTGAVLNITDKLAPQSTSRPSTHIDPAQDDGSGDEEMGEDTPEEVKIAEQLGEFDSIIVWGHGGEVDAESDMYVRGVKEWVGFAESMHCDSEDEEEATQTKTNGGSSTLQKDW